MFLFAALINVLINPFVDRLRVNLEGPDESCEKFNAPWVSKNIFYVRNIHSKLVCESALHFEWYLSEDAIHGRDSFIGH